MTPNLYRAARHLVGWTQTELADKAGLTLRTVQRFENGDTPSKNSAASIREALSNAGVAFVEGGNVEGLIKPL